ncbi:SOS response-associated peptidase family protein [Mesorhizobium sp. B1-1-9]|uniref:SOS response-associated peptidase family protein n=1 Tax=Mesorhizobium sp. B1-1-9 TaxID=2589975 RepID=UPI0024848477|nr:SOS response-associated peptidase family protein [Mesorhizobium sp. B1-1-9]
MCGRYTGYLTWSEIHRLYRLAAAAEIGRNDEPRYNIAPTDEVPFITADDDGNHRLRMGAAACAFFGRRSCPRRPCSTPGSKASARLRPSATRPSPSAA